MSSQEPATASSTTTSTTASTATSSTSSTAAPSTVTTKTPKAKSIKAITAYSVMPDANLVIAAGAVGTGLTNNPNFLTPPVDIPTFNALVTSYTNAIQAAQDGGTNAKAVCDKDRKQVIADLKLLAVYVQNNCDGDMAIFTSSGFKAQQPVSTTGQPAAVPAFKNLDYGTTSGQILVTLAKAANASAYFIRYAPVVNGQPGAWTTVTAVAVNKKLTISGLTQGTLYGFQAQALGVTGFSDWSAMETIVCP